MVRVLCHRSIALYVLLFVSFLGAVLVSACGRKSPPVPPGTLKPLAPVILGHEITPDGITITWEVPTKNTNGSPIFGLKGFEVLRAEEPMDSLCDTCPRRFQSPVWIPFKGKLRNGLKMSYEDHTVRPGYRYTYVVRTVKGIFSKSVPSKEIQAFWHSPPAQPTNGRMERLNGGFVISWEPPKRFMDGHEIGPDDLAHLRYRIFRRLNGKGQWNAIKIGLEKTTFEDRPRPFSLDYQYKIEPVFIYHGESITGPSLFIGSDLGAGGLVDVMPKDLVALKEKDGIELRWQATIHEGQGFNVYRKGPQGIVRLLNREPITERRFKDITLLPRGKYTYWVTVADIKNPRLEGPPSNKVEVEVY